MEEDLPDPVREVAEFKVLGKVAQYTGQVPVLRIAMFGRDDQRDLIVHGHSAEYGEGRHVCCRRDNWSVSCCGT